MAIPPGFSIRVVRLVENPPYPVNVNLPPLKTEPSDKPLRLIGPELDVVIPNDAERHTVLGQFMEAWSQLEGMIGFFLARLLETDRRTAGYVQASMGIRQIVDVMTGFSQLKLSEPQRHRMVNLIERIRKHIGKRNVLVHGHWSLEVNVFMYRGNAAIRPQFVRELLPLDPEILKLVMNPRNQKERAKHIFNLKRIQGATRDVGAISQDLGTFLQEIRISSDWKKQRAKFLSVAEQLETLWSTYRIDPLRATHATFRYQP